MPPLQPEPFDAVRFAAIPLSIEINAMLAALPANADLTEIAVELIYELGERCDNRDFIEIFKEALTARQALTDLGVDLNPP